ncbi:Helix-turn-helix of DDE superfamily endonuclease [Streptomyces sp. DI166]|nr:Helix-turn-helix of DDE superfamily endonuclease [Streptomyces sp. DI166]
MTGVITVSEPSWIAPFTGLSPRQFGKLVTVLRREGADAVRRGRLWSLPLEDRALLVAAYWRTNLTMRQLAPLFGVSKSAADRIIDHLGPMLALQPRKRFAKNTVLIVDGTLVPTRDHTIAERSKNYRYSTNHQVVIDAYTRLVVVVGRPLAGNRNGCKAWVESGAKAAVGKTTTITRRRLPGHRTRHPAPPQARPDRTAGLERGTQQVPQAGPSPRRARLRPHEGVEDSPRLPPQRRRRPPRHARHRSTPTPSTSPCGRCGAPCSTAAGWSSFLTTSAARPKASCSCCTARVSRSSARRRPPSSS